MMDSDSSSEENSTSDCSTESSDDDTLETAQLSENVRIQLPQGLCEHRDVFQELLSPQTWNSLSETNRQHLKRFLPKFPENDEQEKARTLQKLFNGEEFRFESPLIKFHDQLKAGYFRPDIAKMRLMIKKAERREAKQRYRSSRERLKRELMESRRRLLSLVRNLPPGVEPKVEKSASGSCAAMDPIVHKTKRRYFQELATIRSKVDETGFSSDENYPEGPPIPLSRKQKRHLNAIKSSHLLTGEKLYISTMATKPTGLDLERYITPNNNPFFLNEESYKTLLIDHKRRKLQEPHSPDLETKGISISDVVNRTQLPYVKKVSSLPPVINKHHSSSKMPSKKRIKTESSEARANVYLPQSSNSEIDSDSDSVLSSNSAKMKNNRPSKTGKTVAQKPQIVKVKTEIKTENIGQFYPEKPAENASQKSPYYGKVTPATFSDLDGIDMMNLPIDLDDSNIDILELNNKPELMQETHANFLSLIRDVICSTSDHRMSLKTLEERLKSWQENPISPLNDWYSLSDNWVALLPSAVNFLSGNFPEQPDDFVPYMEHKPQLDAYQWIGAGRDSDPLLSPLARYWLDRRNETNTPAGAREKTDDNDPELADRAQTPPPPRCPTAWAVRKAEPEEIRSFREQERRRYDNPHKAFTYRCNGYESVVGPLKGIYNASVGNAKARGHTMLNADRPNFVTILSLVRDATARLPNGEGTRADICELLKSSQYIAGNAPDNVLQSVVSGALDRMHTQFDPCVRYDPKRKIWIYLHRNRSEADFERIHQQHQGMARGAKKGGARTRTPTKTKQKSQKSGGRGEERGRGVQTSVGQSQTVAVSEVAQEEGGGKLGGKGEGREKVVKVEEVDGGKKTGKQQQQQMTQEEKEINEALQAIVQNRVGSPVAKQVSSGKGGKSLVKIVSPSPGKSLIIPTTSAHILKQSDSRATPTKQLTQPQIVTQQLLHTLANQQKQAVQLIQKTASQTTTDDKTEPKTQPKAAAPAVQPQILQGIAPHQLQNIKNVTLLRGVSQSGAIAIADVSEGENSANSGDGAKTEPGKVQNVTTLTPAQQQQLLQSLKQKVMPLQSAVLSPQQQQVILKQKGGIAQLQLQKQVQHAPGTSLLGQSRGNAEVINAKSIVTSTQAPVVAKVLTNAQGQVISVGSLLAHQKQHGSLPQGTTLRVSSSKTGQANIIQLAPTSSKQNPVTQFTVSSQNNFITLTNQPKLVVAASQTASATSSVASTKPVAKAATKTQAMAKFPQKVAAQQLKFITSNVDGQKIVQPKIVVNQQSALKLAASSNKNAANIVKQTGANANTIRMVNATNLNITHIGGKPVLLAGKGSTIQTIQGQNVILQPASAPGGLVFQNAAKTDSSLLGQNAQVVLGPQLKVQPQQNVVLGTSPVRLQAAGGNSGAQRVVLASSSQGQIVAQQILLPAGFQGAAINIKALQGVKVIPIAQAQQGKSVQGRQVFARLMNPANMVRTSQQPTNTQEVVTETLPTTE